MNIDNQLQKIKDDCSPYLDKLKSSKHPNTFLFRGMFDTYYNEIFTTKTIRVNRKATNTPQWFSDVVDEYFVDKFGIPFRSNSVFCTTKAFIAMTYGPLYAIFPIGDFDYCYSPIIEDMYDLSSLAKYGFVKIDMRDRSFKSKEKEDIYPLLDKLEYTNKNFMNWENIDNEIMISCEKYHTIKITRLFEELFPNKYHFSHAQQIEEVLKYLKNIFNKIII